MLFKVAQIILVGMLLTSQVQAKKPKEFEVFDGQVYNGKYYPRVDNIEWGSPSNIEFHIYSKSMAIEMAFKLVPRDGKQPVILIHYYIPEREEHLCRHMLAPHHFKEGYKVYRDRTDSDFDNVIVSMQSIEQKPGVFELPLRPYTDCPESNEEEVDKSVVQQASSASANSNRSQNHSDSTTRSIANHSASSAVEPTQAKPKKNTGAISKDGSVPFSDW